MKKILLLVFGCVSCAIVTAQPSPGSALSLKTCRELALQNNIRIRSARYDIMQAEQQQKEARANYLPTVSASASYFHAADDLVKKDFSLSPDQQQMLGQTIGQLGLDPTALSALPTAFSIEMMQHGTLVNLLAMEPIYAGGQITTGNRLARLQTDVRRLQLEQSESDVIQTTDRYYWQLVSLQEKQKTLAAAQQQIGRIAHDAQVAVDAGITQKNDLLTVRLKQNELRADSLKLANAVGLCRMVLAQYIGAKEAATVCCDSTMEESAPASLLVDFPSALNRRTEAELLERSVEAARLQTRMERGKLLPTVAVGAAGVYHDLLNSSGNVNAIGLATLSLPISNWWTSSHSLKSKKIAEQKAREERDDNRQLLLIQMQGSYDDFDHAYQQVLLARENIAIADENLRLSTNSYRAGTITMSDLLDAQTRHQQSRDRLTEAVADYQNARTAYLIATAQREKL